MHSNIVDTIKYKSEEIIIFLKVGLSIGKSRSAPLNFLRDNEKLTVKFERTYDSNDKINFI